MKILFHIHAYPPEHNAGAEWMAKNIADSLLSFGHEVKVLSSFEGEFDGVKIFKHTHSNKTMLFDWCDIIITHLGWAGEAFTQRLKPVVFLSHNFTKYPISNAVGRIFVAYNSEVNKKLLNYPNESCVLRPPVLKKHYEVEIDEQNQYVTLVNLNSNKGGDFLLHLAKAMPHVQFLGVEGGYESQIKNTQFTNITYIPPTSNMKEVYKKSRIVLMPSKSESWGRVGVEAMMSGIPVIANNKPSAGGKVVGMLEAYGEGASYCPRIEQDVSAWVQEIDRLFNEPEYYQERNEASKKRGIELDAMSRLDLETFENFLKNCVLEFEKNKFHKDIQGNFSGKTYFVEVTKTIILGTENSPRKVGDCIYVNEKQLKTLQSRNACRLLN